MSQATRILVPGGAGYVGSHACKLLARAGFEPVTYDNLSRGHSSLVRFGPLIRGDIRNRAKLRDALEQVRPAACLHFAALAGISCEFGQSRVWNIGHAVPICDFFPEMAGLTDKFL